MTTEKNTLNHLEIIPIEGTQLFQISLVVAMVDYDEEAGDCSALGWLHNLLGGAANGQDIQFGAKAFLDSMLEIGEKKVAICSVKEITQ